ncbi:double-stranded RNA-binding protein 3 isoform X1 [Lactuca sativa]|uniref:double-stranded RNA-binding protein 3 isoform X1 n=1 Tax=Lactuca sativa TaxID=4236 RepID=UPI000CC3B022|nr:double-stranded RNA-binding protein 3 isoform X1 [Lactuca sativa]
MYKCKLYELCQKNGWQKPAYSCKKDGKDHNPLFKASVVVNGVTFSSRSFLKSSKSAGNDAAEVAFTHFTTSHSFCSGSGDVSKTGEAGLPVSPEENTTSVTAATTATPLDQSHSSIEEGDENKSMESYLLCNEVRVYTSIPVTVLPKGNVVLPIGEDKWTVVKLESA